MAADACFFQCLAIFSASGFFSVWRYFQHLVISASGDFCKGREPSIGKGMIKHPPCLTEARRNFWELMQFFQHLAFSASGNIFSIWPFQRLVIFGGIKFLKAPMRSVMKPPSQQQRSATKPPADTPTSTVTLQTSSANSLRTDSRGWGKGGTSGFFKGHPHRVPLGGASSESNIPLGERFDQ